MLARWGVDSRAFARADQRWWKRFSQGGLSMQELRVGRMADVGLTGPEAVAADLAYRDRANAFNLRRGARRLLEGIRAAGLRTVILTNGSVDPQRYKAEQTGLLHLVAGVVVSEEIGHHKPHPHAFDAALRVTGDPPRRAAMVGDRWEFDIEGALESGFARAVWVTRSRRRPDEARVRVVKSLPLVLPALLN